MTDTMRAVVFHGAHDVRVEKVAIPLPGPGEILLKVVSVGVCGTDAHEFESGPHMFPTSTPHAHSGHSGPMVMGHEFAGRVVSHGPGVSSFGFNELVVCGAGVSCGDCIQCDRGRTNLCERYWTVGLQADGGLAEYVVAPANICFSADEWGLSEHLAGMCQPMAIAVHATRRGRLTPDDQVIILGAGGIGAFLVSAAATVTSTVAVVDLDSERLDIALSNGAKFIHQASGNDDVAALKRNWGIRPTVVFEVSGTPAGLRAANQWLEPGGRLVLVGLQDEEQLLHYRSTSLVEHELIGTNAHVASEDMPRALEILASGVGEWSRIAPQVIPLESAVTEGLELIAHRKSRQIKTLIDPRISDTQTSNMSLRPKRQVP